MKKSGVQLLTGTKYIPIDLPFAKIIGEGRENSSVSLCAAKVSSPVKGLHKGCLPFLSFCVFDNNICIAGQFSRMDFAKGFSLNDQSVRGIITLSYNSPRCDSMSASIFVTWEPKTTSRGIVVEIIGLSKSGNEIPYKRIPAVPVQIIASFAHGEGVIGSVASADDVQGERLVFKRRILRDTAGGGAGVSGVIGKCPGIRRRPRLNSLMDRRWLKRRSCW